MQQDPATDRTDHQESPRSSSTPTKRHFPARAMKWLANGDLVLLVSMLVICASIWGFMELADEMQEGATLKFDHAILLQLRDSGDISNPIGPGWVEEMGRDFTALGGVPVLTLMSLGIVGYLLMYGSRKIALVVFVAALGALVFSNVLKEILDRPRPDLVSHGTRVYTSSFPSAHAMQAATTYLTLGALLARVQRRRNIKLYIMSVAISITFLVGFSRVYLGVHWPTDVLAGWTAGAIWAIFCWLLARKLQRQRKLQYVVTDENANSAPQSHPS